MGMWHMFTHTHLCTHTYTHTPNTQGKDKERDARKGCGVGVGGVPWIYIFQPRWNLGLLSSTLRLVVLALILPHRCSFLVTIPTKKKGAKKRKVQKKIFKRKKKRTKQEKKKKKRNHFCQPDSEVSLILSGPLIPLPRVLCFSCQST